VAKYGYVMGGRRAGGRWATALVIAGPDLSLARRYTLAVLVIVLQVGDIVTTRWLLARGGQETNPIAQALIASGRFEAVKISLAGVVGMLILVAPLRHTTRRVILAVVVLYGLLLLFHGIELSGALAA